MDRIEIIGGNSLNGKIKISGSKKHSLVLVNFSQKSENIIHLSNKIKNEISKKFDITLEYEPTLIT